LCEAEVSPLMAKKTQPISNPHPNLVTLTFIPQPPKNIRKKLNTIHPIILLTEHTISSSIIMKEMQIKV
jgi:hypothetical protein